MTDSPPTDLSSLRTQAAATALIPASDRERIASLVEMVGTLDVTDAASNEEAGGYLNDVKGLREALETRVTDLRRPHMAAANAISAEAKPFIDNLKDGEQHLRGLVTRYEVQKQRERQEEESRREELLIRSIEENPQDAQEALEALMVPVVQERAPDGVRLTGRWVADVVDKAALVAAVAAGDFPLALVEVHMPTLNNLARAYKDSARIPGVVVRWEPGVSVRGTR